MKKVTRAHRSIAVPEANWQQWIAEAGAARLHRTEPHRGITTGAENLPVTANGRISQEAIAQLAYALWEDRGRPHGSAEQDWIQAERLLAEQNSH